MPQLDKFTFLNQILGLIFFFFLIYIYIRGTVLPKINTVLKYRTKKSLKLLHHEKATQRLYSNSNYYFSKWAVNYIEHCIDVLSLVFVKSKKYTSENIAILQKNLRKKELPLNFNNSNSFVLQFLDKNIIYAYSSKNAIEAKRIKKIN